MIDRFTSPAPRVPGDPRAAEDHTVLAEVERAFGHEPAWLRSRIAAFVGRVLAPQHKEPS